MTAFLFFFEAEDGIRDVAVTGVQTCALPISHCQATRLAMRDVRTYQISTAAAPTSLAVWSWGSVHATYAARGSVVPIAAQRAIRAARRRTRCVHSAHSPPMGIPATNSPHLAQGG